MLKMAHRSSGFTAIEMMIALAIMGILVSLAIPSFTTYIDNTKVKTTAQSFLSGVQSARSEALRRNSPVDFIVTDTAYPALIANHVTLGQVIPDGSIVANSNASNWVVLAPTINPDDNLPINVFVEGKLGAEGSGRNTAAVLPIAVTGTTGTIRFNNFGATTLAAAASFQFSNPNGGQCAPAGPIRCMTVLIAIGGGARICDPAVAAGDTRAC
jgi:type IV fimbrial biogenesis protein FimT